MNKVLVKWFVHKECGAIWNEKEKSQCSCPKDVRLNSTPPVEFFLQENIAPTGIVFLD